MRKAVISASACSQAAGAGGWRNRPEVVGRFAEETGETDGVKESEKFVSATGIHVAFDGYGIDGKSGAILHEARTGRMGGRESNLFIRCLFI